MAKHHERKAHHTKPPLQSAARTWLLPGGACQSWSQTIQTTTAGPEWTATAVTNARKKRESDATQVELVASRHCRVKHCAAARDRHPEHVCASTPVSNIIRTAQRCCASCKGHDGLVRGPTERPRSVERAHTCAHLTERQSNSDIACGEVVCASKQGMRVEIDRAGRRNAFRQGCGEMLRTRNY
jgi:hypothetical protein